MQLKSQSTGDSAVAYVNNGLRYMFENLSFSDTNVNVFYDMAGHFSDTQWWTNYSSDTMNTMLFTTIYEELWWMQFDTTGIETIEEYYTHAQQHFPDTNEIGIIRYGFYQLNDSMVFYDTTYYTYDSVNLQYNDRIGRSTEPYAYQTIFTSAALRNRVSSPYATWKIDPQNILTDYNNQFITDPVTGNDLIIDFADGTGWHSISADSISYHYCEYDTTGKTVLRVAVVENGTGDTIDFSQFSVIIGGNLVSDADQPDIVWDTNGMNVGIWNSCATGDSIQDPKYIIYAEGFDFLRELDVNHYYSERFKKTGLAELRNFGYNIIIVDWKKPGASMSSNGQRLAGLILNLKCSLSTGDIDTLHQFVVMGESMGGVIARYALSWIEDNPNITPCRPDLIHNTRLFVSIDAPQNGANIPMAFQELANHWSSLTVLPWMVRLSMRNTWDMLNCNAAMQLLKQHQSTNPYNVYPFTSIYDALYTRTLLSSLFFDSLEAMNPGNIGFPKYCKTIGMSHGLLTGEHLVTTGGVQAQPGDVFLQGEGELILRVLWQDLNIADLDLLLRSPDGTSDEFFEFRRGLVFWRPVIPTRRITIGFCPFCIRLRIPWGVPRFEVDYITNKGYSRFSTTCDLWDVMPGGVYEFGWIIDDFLEPRTLFDFQFDLIFDINTPIGPGLQVNIQDLDIIANIDMNFNGALNGFNFIPVQSGIHYHTGSGFSLDDNIYSEDATTIMGRTPFDIVTGGVNGIGGFPQTQIQHTLPRNNSLSWKFPMLNRNHLWSFMNHRLNDNLINDTLYAGPSPLYAFWLNREIGDEELMLENYTLHHTAFFEAEYIIQAGPMLNPYYEYPSQNASEWFLPFEGVGGSPNLYGYNLDNNAIFSKDSTFVVENTQWAILKADSIINTGVNGGMTGDHFDLFAPQDVCILDFYCFGNYGLSNSMYADCDTTATYKRGKMNEQTDIEFEALIWPNPASKDERVTIRLNGTTQGRLELFNLQGSRLHVERFNTEANLAALNLNRLNLAQGVYLIVLHDEVQNITFNHKLIIQ